VVEVVTNPHELRVPARFAHVSRRIARPCDWLSLFAVGSPAGTVCSIVIGGGSSCGSRCLSKNQQQDRRLQTQRRSNIYQSENTSSSSLPPFDALLFICQPFWNHLLLVSHHYKYRVTEKRKERIDPIRRIIIMPACLRDSERW
jgi:hypothetical protein